MSSRDRFGGDYVVPTYLAPDDTGWYHFLYGSVPGHQLDLIVRPELPHGSLTPQHFSHLLEFIKYIEPLDGTPFAFAIGNLSRDDTQHVPGHGGLTLMFGLRVRGAMDHAGRPSPPFSHAIAAIDRELDADMIEATAMSFHRRMIGVGERDGQGVAFYRAYAEAGTRDSGVTAALVDHYTSSFGDLPRPERSALRQAWRADDHARPGRIVIVHPDGALFSAIVSCAARLASILYRSDVRWSSITTGREADSENGVSIRMIPERNMRGHHAGGGLVLQIGDVPANDDDAARRLFGARPIERPARATVGGEGFGELRSGSSPEDAAAAGGGEALRVDYAEANVAPAEIALTPGRVPDDEATTNVMRKVEPPPLPIAPERLPSRGKRWWYVLPAAGAVCVAAFAVAIAAREERVSVLAPSPFEPAERALAALTDPLADGTTGVRAETARPAQEVERDATRGNQQPQAMKNASRPAVARGTTGRGAAGPPSSAKRNERAANGGPIFRSLPGN